MFIMTQDSCLYFKEMRASGEAPESIFEWLGSLCKQKKCMCPGRLKGKRTRPSTSSTTTKKKRFKLKHWV